MVRREEDPDADFKFNKGLFQNEEQEQKARQSRLSRTLNCEKTRQGKTMEIREQYCE